jgi:hypothetical protein
MSGGASIIIAINDENRWSQAVAPCRQDAFQQSRRGRLSPSSPSWDLAAFGAQK